VEGLLLGAAMGTAGLTPAVAGARLAAPGEPHGRRQIVVFDVRFAASRRFGAETGQGAWLTRGIRGDVTPLWHDLLEVRWHRYSTALHGMTTARSFQCIEQLVADHFWRVTSLAPGRGLVTWALAPARTPT